MSRLDWDKAREQDRARKANEAAKPRHEGVRRRAARQAALADFVKRQRIVCFKCGAETADWAKTGTSKHGPWAICVGCASRRD